MGFPEDGTFNRFRGSFPDALTEDDTGTVVATFTSENDGDNDYLIANIASINWAQQSSPYEFDFYLTGPPYAQTIDITTMLCVSRDTDGNIIDGDPDTSPIGATWDNVNDEITVTQNVSNDITLSITDTDAGAEGATLSISYTTAAPFLKFSWIKIIVPKANKMYSNYAVDSSTGAVTASTRNVGS